MARVMKTVAATRRCDNQLVITVDPLKAARGHRTLPRGGVHDSEKRPGRAKGERRWRREI